MSKKHKKLPTFVYRQENVARDRRVREVTEAIYQAIVDGFMSQKEFAQVFEAVNTKLEDRKRQDALREKSNAKAKSGRR